MNGWYLQPLHYLINASNLKRATEVLLAFQMLPNQRSFHFKDFGALNLYNKHHHSAS